MTTTATTETVIVPTPVPGSAEHELAMIAKVDSVNNSAPTDEVVPEAVPAAVRPEHIPEKFWDAAKGEVNHEAWAKSYAELEKANSNKPATETPPVEAPAETDAAKAELEKVGVDYTSLQDEFAAKGELSEESYKLLAEKAGLSRDMVDNYIEGQKARAVSFEMSAYEAAGGKEQFAAMSTWAAANLSEKEINAFNEGVNGSEAHMRLAVEGLRSKYQAVNGSEPGLLHGGNTDVAMGFESRAQMTAAMKDPRYAKDPAYRKSVERKVGLSNIW